jgi:hypothetical protein
VLALDCCAIAAICCNAVEVISVLASISSAAALDCSAIAAICSISCSVESVVACTARIESAERATCCAIVSTDWIIAPKPCATSVETCAPCCTASRLCSIACTVCSVLVSTCWMMDWISRVAFALRSARPAHLFGDDRKPAPRLARARRFNRRVQGKQVRLAGDFLNRLQNPADGGGHLREFLEFLRDLAGLLVDAGHHALGELERVASLFGDLGGVCGGLLGLLELVEGLADACGDGVHLLDAYAGGLRGLFGALSDLAHDAGDLVHLSDAVFGGVCGLLGAAGDLLGGLLELGEAEVRVVALRERYAPSHVPSHPPSCTLHRHFGQPVRSGSRRCSLGWRPVLQWRSPAASTSRRARMAVLML